MMAHTASHMRWENRSASARRQESRCSEMALLSDAPVLDPHAQQVQIQQPQNIRSTQQRGASRKTQQV